MNIILFSSSLRVLQNSKLKHKDITIGLFLQFNKFIKNNPHERTTTAKCTNSMRKKKMVILCYQGPTNKVGKTDLQRVISART